MQFPSLIIHVLRNDGPDHGLIPTADHRPFIPATGILPPGAQTIIASACRHEQRA
jgi:hypothetical protein